MLSIRNRWLWLSHNRGAREVNQPALTSMQSRGALGRVEHDGTRVEVGSVAQPVDDRPTHQIHVGGAVVDQFHPFTIRVGVTVHGGVGEHFGELDGVVHTGLESDPVGIRISRGRIGRAPTDRWFAHRPSGPCRVV